MEIEEIKAEILKMHIKWKSLSDSFDDDKYAEIYESDVRSLIISYCESKGYEVEGYPFQKRILAETDQYYDEDYFCYERELKYLDVLAATKEDVLELMYFYSKTFWPDQVDSLEEYRVYLIEGNENNPYDIEF
ncbi:hypothetical protein SAMN04488062_102251 [Flavobacterium omnivorum]|uniref:Uncharacterized protein n=2 Tax=Flavobacterium TaxID=237 RepID=A0A1G7XBX7_9FLAO|nr:hypothetical protein [Flavobacterium omnivorum]SDG81709.1 hypothetical protein SAMN04488062_102251 [Flavobacterium omnivorum]